jgi:hypothetical protein
LPSVGETIRSLFQDGLCEGTNSVLRFTFCAFGPAREKPASFSGGAGLKRAGQAAAGAAQKAGTAAAGAVRGAGQAVAGVAGQAAGAVKGAYQAGERNSLIQGLNKSIQNTVAVADKAIQSAGGDQNLINALDQVKQIVAHAGEQMKTEKLAEALKEGKKPIKPGKILRRKTK